MPKPIAPDDISPRATKAVDALRALKDEGLSYEQIAEKCGVAWNTVRNALLGLGHIRHDIVERIYRRLKIK